jgi:hypothetical protein
LLLDLAEVMSVTPASPAPGPPKKTDDKSFFDVSKYNETNSVEQSLSGEGGQEISCLLWNPKVSYFAYHWIIF